MSDSKPNGTVEVATFKDSDGKFFITVVHVDRDGLAEIVGNEYRNMDEAKSAAWELAQRLGAVTVPTRKVQP